jgi:hypothetical protein
MASSRVDFVVGTRGRNTVATPLGRVAPGSILAELVTPALPQCFAFASTSHEALAARAPGARIVNVQSAMARAAGFEPAISGLEPDALARLSYAPIGMIPKSGNRFSEKDHAQT